MQSSKGKDVLPLSNTPMGNTSIPITRAHSPSPSDAAHVKKLTTCQTFRKHGLPHSIFSDPLDSTSSDEMSFDEEDMYGSDPNIETISLGAGSNQKSQCPEEDVVYAPHAQTINTILYLWQHSDGIPEFDSISLAISKMEIMARALCDADGIDISALGGEGEEGIASALLPQSTSDMSMGVDETMFQM